MAYDGSTLEPMHVVPPPGLEHARSPWQQDRASHWQQDAASHWQQDMTPAYIDYTQNHHCMTPDGASQQSFALCDGAYRRGGAVCFNKKLGKGGGGRWWSKLGGMPLRCPMSNFPICLLPYPPFKLRVFPGRAFPYYLVDGKFLVLQTIATGSFQAMGRELTDGDVQELDAHVRRCKLGRFRLGDFGNLLLQSSFENLKSYIEAAQEEFEKLKDLQKVRLSQIKKLKPSNSDDQSVVDSDQGSALASRLSHCAGRASVSTMYSSEEFDSGSGCD